MQSRSFCSSTSAGVLLEDVVAAGLGGVLEPEDGLGVEQVELAVAAPLVLAPFRGAGRPDVAAGVGAAVVVERLVRRSPPGRCRRPATAVLSK